MLLAGTSEHTPVLLPFLFLPSSTQGDGNIRYYEVSADKPHLSYLTEYRSYNPQKGIGERWAGDLEGWCEGSAWVGSSCLQRGLCLGCTVACRRLSRKASQRR